MNEMRKLIERLDKIITEDPEPKEEFKQTLAGTYNEVDAIVDELVRAVIFEIEDVRHSKEFDIDLSNKKELADLVDEFVEQNIDTDIDILRRIEKAITKIVISRVIKKQNYE